MGVLTNPSIVSSGIRSPQPGRVTHGPCTVSGPTSPLNHRFVSSTLIDSSPSRSCDGTWGQFCDSSREENDITGLLQAADQSSLLSFMQTHWKDSGGDDNSFWAHEWNKHGTCMRYVGATSSPLVIFLTLPYSTLGPNCVADPKQAAVYFFTSTVNLFKGLPTYDWLAAGGVTPSSTATYTRTAIVDALKAASAYGFTVGIECDSGALNQVNYYYNVSADLHTVRSVNPSNAPDHVLGKRIHH
jgi:Ribonuclease T2 family